MNTAEFLPLDDGNNEKGIVYAANEARFSAANYSEPLTTFTVGWQDPENTLELLDFIAPVIHVGKRFEFKKATENEAFLSETDDIRAIGSAFKRIEFTGSSVMSKTFNKGLTVRVDHDDIASDNWQESYVQMLLKRLVRNELRRAISALNGAATSTSVTWGGSGNQLNPDADLRTDLALAADATGVRPNRILFGEGAWDIRSNVYDIQNTAAAQRAATLNMEDLAHKLFVDEIRVMSARYQSSASGKSKILGNDIYMFYTRNDLIKDEPANIKRFVTPIDGNNFRVYVDEQSKFTDITVEHYSNIIITSSTGVRKLAVTSGL